MPAKKLLLATLIATLLAGCGGGAANQALPGDGTYDDTVVSDDYGASTDGTTDPYAGTTGSTTADGAIGDATAAGYTLRGLVSDAEGKPLAGAKVSIGAQTTLTNAAGEFEISAISDSQVWVDVTKDGFEAISRFNVPFSTDKPIADKEFKLAAGTGTTPGGGTATGPVFSHEGTFGGPKWKSMAAMAINGDQVFVLGKIDKALWFDRSAVVVFNANTGEEEGRIGDKLFSKVPKTASSIKFDAGQVVVSDGTHRVTFDASGAFVKTATGGGFSAAKTAVDAERGITYTLKAGNKIDLKKGAETLTFNLTDIGNAKSIATDAAGHLLVLDDSQKTVHIFTYE